MTANSAAEKPTTIAAEFEYYRVPYEKWGLMLTRLRQMGFETVVIPLLWRLHQPEAQRIDLTGATRAQANLAGLLRLCESLDLSCQLNLGPRNNNQTLNDGLPYWLKAETRDKAVEDWYQAVSQLTVDRQTPEGPVTALHLTAMGDHQLTQHVTAVRWPIWLRKKYGSVEALNAAYGTNYASVSRVKFPALSDEPKTSPQRDAAVFLGELAETTLTQRRQIFRQAGWTTPIYDSQTDFEFVTPSRLPSGEQDIKSKAAALVVQQLVRVDPDPAHVGQGTVWATQGPIRTDGSVRRTFWAIRRLLWADELTTVTDDGPLVRVTAQGGVVSAGQDLPVKIALPKELKPAVYRLRLTGALVEESARVYRHKLTGSYVAEDHTAQTDLLLLVETATTPLEPATEAYLRRLLLAQIHTLRHCGEQSQTLSKALAPISPAAAEAPSTQRRPGSYTLEEARRGLQKADEALRKAVQSIGGLEAGFDVILDRQDAPAPAPAGGLPITPNLVDSPAREQLIEVGKRCAVVAPLLVDAADTMAAVLEGEKALSVVQYQTSYVTAVEAAQTAQKHLLEVLAQMRLEIAAETLPLVSWRIHNQVQGIIEQLRWGILRG